MSRGFYRQQLPDVVGTGNAFHFRQLARQHISGAIAHITRAEQCKPGCTGEALIHVKAALEALHQGGWVSEVKSE
jgi:hypothetical protein